MAIGSFQLATVSGYLFSFVGYSRWLLVEFSGPQKVAIGSTLEAPVSGFKVKGTTVRTVRSADLSS